MFEYTETFLLQDIIKTHNAFVMDRYAVSIIIKSLPLQKGSISLYSFTADSLL